MQISVPHRTVADTGSFPVNPEGVAQWLATLNPLDSEADAREVYRGLKNSNRLHNDISNRRSVISCFVPVLRELQNHLSELSDAQPLPLTREFARHARLRDALLREEAFAFKILLCDSDIPSPDDARRAMQALARQAESLIHAYKNIPDALIQDAHQLYALAEDKKLLETQPGAELATVQDHYRYILLLCISDLKQQRTRQLPLVMDFLRTAVVDIHIKRDRQTQNSDNNALDARAGSLKHSEYAIDLHRGSRPEPALSVLIKSPTDVRWFSVEPLLDRINTLSRKIQANSGLAPANNILERQSLARLHVALSRSRQRRTARYITALPQRVVLGHKEICANLLYQPTEIAPDTDSGWIVTNRTHNGLCLQSNQCRAGMVQVGELISIADAGKPLVKATTLESSRIEVLLGTVRWVHADRTIGLRLGVEYMAKTVLPVTVTQKPGHADKQSSLDNSKLIAENALIVACRINDKVLQTILLPAYLYGKDDRLVASQGGRSRVIQLRSCMQSNGLYSQFSLLPTK